MTTAERVKAGWVAIFKPGTHKAMNGQTYTFSDKDVEAIASGYSPTLHQSPAVIGHPAIDAPAYGWADSVEFADGWLWAKLKDVYPQFSDWVKQGWYRNISASFYPPEKSPVAGQYYLKHIGFLGAAPPAVPGLPHAAFTAGESLEFDQWGAGRSTAEFSGEEEPEMEQKTFTEWLRAGLQEMGLLKPAPLPIPVEAPPPPPQFSEAQVREREVIAADKAKADAEAAAESQRRAATVHAEVTAFVDAGVAAGTFLPAWKAAGIPEVIEQSMLSKIEVAFAEGAPPKQAGKILMELFASLPKIVPLGEHATGAAADPDTALKAEFAAGLAVHDQMGVSFETFKKAKEAKA
jgi:hypothetical protein